MIDYLSNKRYIIYYIFLLLVIMLWSGTQKVVPPLPVRFAFLFAAILPVWKEPVAVISSILAFYSLSVFGLTCLMPTEYEFYLILFITLALMHSSRKIISIEMPTVVLCILMIESLFVGLYNDGEINRLTYGLIIVLIACRIADCKEYTSIKYFKSAFIAIGVALSLMQILYWNNFSSSYINEDFERSGWTDPNYYGMIIGLGAVCLMGEVINNRLKGVRLYLTLAGIILNVVAILMNASRGTILAVVVYYCIMFLFSQRSKKIKFVVLLFSFVIIFFLYSYNYFDFVIYRFQADESFGSHRGDIWLVKYNEFNSLNFINQLFGLGFTGGLHLGSYVASHNDYVSFLIDYGYVGFLMNLLLWIYPLWKLPKKSQAYPVVLSSIAYMATCGFTLEILTTGTLIFWFFYLYILLVRSNYLYGSNESTMDN